MAGGARCRAADRGLGERLLRGKTPGDLGKGATVLCCGTCASPGAQ